MPNLRRYLWLVLPLWLALICFSPLYCAGETQSSEDDRKKIADLIEALGSPNYSTRTEAEDALKSLGVKALDQLNSAKNHPNLQIAAMSRYLLSSNNTIWFYEGDTPRIRKQLSNYAIANPSDRDTILSHLAELDSDEGVPALARIARYEYNGDLSKRAALKLMSMEDAYLSPEQLRMRWTSVNEIASGASNSASTWLTHYAKTYLQSISQNPASYRQDMTSITQDIVLPKPFDAYDFRVLPLGLTKFASFTVRMAPSENETQWWKDQIDQEVHLLNIPSEDTSISVVEALCRVGCEYELRCGNKRDAIELARELFSLPIRASEIQSVLRRVTWAIDYGMPALAGEMMQKADEGAKVKNSHLLRGEVGDMQLAYYSSPLWKYHLAEAYFWQGKFDEANATAEDALHSPNYSDYPYGMQIHLQTRMMYQWAANEFLNEQKNKKSYSEVTLFNCVRVYLYFLQDGRDYEKYVETAESIIERLDKDPSYADEVKQALQLANMDDFRASYLFAKGQLHKKRGEFDAAKASFLDTYKLQSENVDALIELDKLQGDAAFEKEIDTLLDKELDLLLKKAKQYEEDMRTTLPDRLASVKDELANALNSYAWVLCNTNRELDKALQTSITSNRMKKNSAEYTDTLARCYFVKGDLKNAIYWQERSVSLKPQQRQLLLTLLEYRDAAKTKSDSQ